MRPMPVEDSTELARQLRRLADDLQRISDGRGPDVADLEAAPLLTAWTPMIVPTQEGALAGLVRGHPGIADGHRTVTSAVVALDPALAWVRTWSRFYRLGAPAERIEGVGHA